MKLYAFSTGNLAVRKKTFVPSADKEEKILTPSQCFLILHPKGSVLVDTGIGQDVCTDPEHYWGGAARAFWPSTTPMEDILIQLEKCGCPAEELESIILTHMHMDHIGNNRFFPAADYYVQRRELEIARKPESEGNGYYRRDWDYPLLYTPVDGRKDFFGDGSVVMEPMPGHTPGMQVVIVTLPETGTVVLASDAVGMMANLLEGEVPKNTVDKEAYVQSVAKLKKMHDDGALVICGHDPDQWETIKKAPAFYS